MAGTSIMNLLSGLFILMTENVLKKQLKMPSTEEDLIALTIESFVLMVSRGLFIRKVRSHIMHL